MDDLSLTEEVANSVNDKAKSTNMVNSSEMLARYY